MPRDAQPSQSCSRCGRSRGGPGHGCERVWRLGMFSLRHTGFVRSDGSLSHLYWSLGWRWRGDSHTFRFAPSLGSHRNVSEQYRRELRERELNSSFYLDDPDDDVPPSAIARRHAANGGT